MTTTKENVPGTAGFSIPGVAAADANELAGLLQDRLTALIDLALTLKHVHWNVVGAQFIGIHTMVDGQVDAVREMADGVAERIAALGGVPRGTPESVVSRRSWDDYSLGRADAMAHLAALDAVYVGVIESHRKAIAASAELDPVTEDLLIGQCGRLEQFHWFVRAHLENESGELERMPELDWPAV